MTFAQWFFLFGMTYVLIVAVGLFVSKRRLLFTGSGIIVRCVAGENVNVGDVVHIGKIELHEHPERVYVTHDGGGPVLGVVMKTKMRGDVVRILCSGFGKIRGLDLDVGISLYLGYDGRIRAGLPEESQEHIYYIGQAIAKGLHVRPFYIGKRAF